jgi:hypothetical protein
MTGKAVHRLHQYENGQSTAPRMGETFCLHAQPMSVPMKQFRFGVAASLVMTVFIMISDSLAAEKPIRVFILAGQSNMEGHARIETFDYLSDDPVTRPLLQKMRDAYGKPRVCDGVWISYLTCQGDHNGEGFGQLTAGYGSRSNPAEDGGKIGPEFTFGIMMDEAFEEPVLIIKTAWAASRSSMISGTRVPVSTRGRKRIFKKNVDPKAARAIPIDGCCNTSNMFSRISVA